MKHTPLDQLVNVGLHSIGKAAMSRDERLKRWADVLGREPQRKLRTLEGTEYQRGEARARMRADQSPISVAFADAVLRAEGLSDDTYGEAKRFFELSDRELHDVVCYCHFGGTMTAAAAALRVSVFANHTNHARAPSGFRRAWQALAG